MNKRDRDKIAEPENVIDNTRAGMFIFLLLLAIPIISTIAYGAVDPWAMSLLAVAVAIIILLWVRDAWQTGELRFSSNAIQLPVIGLIVVGLVQLLPLGSAGEASELLSAPVSNTLTLDPYATRFFVVRLAVNLVFFAAALTFINSRPRLQKTVVTIIVFGAAMAFFGILQRLANPEAIYGLRPTPQAIPFGPFVNQHHFAGFMEMTSGLALGLLFGMPAARDKKLLLAMAAIVMGMALIFTGSRGGLISFAGVVAFAAIASFFLGAREKKKSGELHQGEGPRRTLLLATGGASVIILAAVAAVFFGGGDSFIRGTGLSENQADISSGRFHFWSVGVQIFKERPLLGAGLDAFGVAFSEFDTRNGQFRVENAHNDYLQILADAGIIGFACVLAFILLLFRKSLRNVVSATDGFCRAASIGALSGCFGILVHSFFDFPLRTTSNGFFFLLLAVIAMMPFANQTLSSRRKQIS